MPGSESGDTKRAPTGAGEALFNLLSRYGDRRAPNLRPAHRDRSWVRGCRRDDHLRQRLLSDVRDDRFRLAFLAEIDQQQQHPCQAFLALVEKLVHQVRFDPDVARQQMIHKKFGEGELVMEHADHGRFH